MFTSHFSLSIEDLPPAASGSQALTVPDGVSTVPTMVRGDWVLFHPVYTPEELKAVDVSSVFF
jgi:ubiquinol oxidase